jgi:signal transduction histidine kinase
MPVLYLKLAKLFKTQGFRDILFFSSFLFIAGCNSNTQKDEHREYFDPIFMRIDTMSKIGKQKAVELLDSAYNAFPNPGIGDLYSIDSVKSGIYWSDPVKALAYSDTLVNIAGQRLQEEKYAVRYASALHYKGDRFAQVKRYNESLQYYTLAKEAVLKYVKNACGMVAFGASEAKILFIQKKYMLAAKYFLDHYNYFLKNCDADTFESLMNLGMNLNNAALSYLKAGLYDSAAYYQDSALNVISRGEHKFPAEHSNIEYALGVIYADQGEVSAAKGKFDEAETLYKKSINLVGGKDVPYAQSTRARLVELYFKESKRDSVEKALSELKTSLDSMTNEAQLIEYNKLKIRNFVLQKKFDSVLSYQLKYDSLRDLMLSRDKSLVSIDLSSELENLQLKYSNEVLQRESKIKNQYLIISAVIFLMAAIIALQIWYSLRKTRKMSLHIQVKNDELQRAFTLLEQSHAENSRIMKIVAHDLKNPISAMKNLAYSLLKKEPVSPQKNALEIIHDSSMNSLALINDLLYEKKNFSQVAKERVDMKKMVEQCVELLQAKANEKNQKLKIEAEQVFAFINVEKIWRVISNIVSNAIKFSYIDAEINVRLQKKEDYVLLSVSDNGIGIPPAIGDKIFSITDEGRRPGTSGEQSHGLGLSISQIIIAEHEGKIWFESEKGKGTVFYVKLPA